MDFKRSFLSILVSTVGHGRDTEAMPSQWAVNTVNTMLSPQLKGQPLWLGDSEVQVVLGDVNAPKHQHTQVGDQKRPRPKAPPNVFVPPVTQCERSFKPPKCFRNFPRTSSGQKAPGGSSSLRNPRNRAGGARGTSLRASPRPGLWGSAGRWSSWRVDVSFSTRRVVLLHRKSV